MTVKVALIGAGERALAWAPHLSRGDIKLAVFDEDRTKAQALAAVAPATVLTRLQAVCSQEPKVVFLATEASKTSDVALKVLEHCRGLRTLVLGSSPATISARADCEAMVRAARNAEIGVYRSLPKLVEAKGILGRIASGNYGTVHHVSYLGFRRARASDESVRTARSDALSLIEAVTSSETSRRVMLQRQGSSEVLTIQAGATLATARLAAGVDIPVAERVHVTVFCERATVDWLHEDTTAPHRRYEGLPTITPYLGERIVPLRPLDAVRTGWDAREIEVDQLFTLQAPPVDGQCGLRVLADELAAAKADFEPGTWFTVEDITP